MKKVAIYYGSTSGNCENIAHKIAQELGLNSSDVRNASEINAEEIASSDVLLLGSSTWGCGDLQDDWYSALDVLKSADLKGKVVAIFGCGDSQSYDTTFCDAMGQIYDALSNTGCTFAGAVSTEGYSFSESTSVRNDEFVGLALDEDNESNLTDKRIAAWVEALRPILD